MSVAVCRELLPDLLGQDWVPLNREGKGSLLSAGLATIPSVTEVSRTSLLCGRLSQGTSADEQAGFEAHPVLRAHCKSGFPPILFHKSALRGEGDTVLAGDVREEIASPNRRIIGVVINAIDDQLLKGEQLDTRWSRDTIPVLPALLHEAKQSRRIVVITSDHGHVLDCGSVARPGEGGERWRVCRGCARRGRAAAEWAPGLDGRVECGDRPLVGEDPVRDQEERVSWRCFSPGDGDPDRGPCPFGRVSARVGRRAGRRAALVGGAGSRSRGYGEGSGPNETSKARADGPLVQHGRGEP